MDLETLAFNRDPAFIGDPASIRTLASSSLSSLISSVPVFPVYVNLTLHMLILSMYIYLVSKKTRIICVSTKCWGSYDVTSVWLVLTTRYVFLENLGVYLRPSV